MYAPVPITIVLSCLHILLGIISFVTGVLSSIHALVWLAHTVSPIFSGCFVSDQNKNIKILKFIKEILFNLFKFIICGGTGLLLLKHRTQYSVRAFVKK